LFTGVLAGSYPSFFLSRFNPIIVLKGSFLKSHKAVTPRKVLVVVQFSFAILLIIATIVVRDQIRHGKDKEPGYNRNNLVYLYMNEDLEKNYLPWKNELLGSGTAVSVTKTLSPITENWSNTTGIEWPGKEQGDKTLVDRFAGDDHVARTLGLELVKGRDFDLKQFPTDSFAVLLNEAAVQAMKLKDPIGTVLKDDGRDYHVVGVFKNVVVRSPFWPITPMVVQGSGSFFNVVHVKLDPARKDGESLKQMERITQKYSPAYPFDAFFVDQQYAKKFESEERSSKLAGLFAGLAIFISCLGLFGLATFMAESRIKEIGVRKVLGASVKDIATLLSKDFLKLVAIAFVIASPLAYWGMHSWLQGYPYRISVPLSAFLLAGILSLLIALLTVSSQAIRAALSNPVKSLRSE
jgi:ABC-type antimicrobial peptide transport system permease subunit